MILFAATLQRPVQRRLLMLLNALTAIEICYFSLGDLRFHQYVVSWAHPSLHPKRQAVIAQLTVECPISLQLSATSSSKIAHFSRGIESPIWHMVHRSTRVINTNDISIGSAVFVWVQMQWCTMHCQWGRNYKNPQNCSFPLGFHHPAGRGSSHGEKQHTQNFY